MKKKLLFLVIVFSFFMCSEVKALTLNDLYNDLSALQSSYDAAQKKANLTKQELNNLNNYDLSILSEREKLWITIASLIGANDSRYRHKYPVNTLYTPVSFDYYWTIVKRIIKGKRGL